MWHFVADLHLNHANIIKYCKRPFMSSEEKEMMGLVDRGTIPASDFRISQKTTDLMTDTILDSINAAVSQNDTLVIAGDYCFAKRDARYNVAQQFRRRINCKNVIVVWGNHDDRRSLGSLFQETYDQCVFNVDAQNIFVNHYPARSWDMAHHGCWMLYGHVHDLYGPEDNGDIMPYEKKVYSDGFDSVLSRYGIGNENGERDKAVQDLLAVCASLNGIDYTCDVGVDNRIRGEHIPFGTPWSMDHLRDYMAKKKSRWEARAAGHKALRDVSSLKVQN